MLDWNGYSCSEKSLILITRTFGQSIFDNMLKWVSFVTTYSASAAIAQSTNLLSSTSDFIRSKWTYMSWYFVWGSLAIASTIFLAILGDVFVAMISSYSSRISVLTHKEMLPFKMPVQILWYGLFDGRACNRQLVSRTMRRMAIFGSHVFFAPVFYCLFVNLPFIPHGVNSILGFVGEEMSQ